MGSWNDFNDAQSNTNLIPKGTLAKVRLVDSGAKRNVCIEPYCERFSKFV